MKFDLQRFSGLDQYTVVLLHCNQSSILDECENEWHIEGQPVLNSSYYKFNNTALQFDSNSRIHMKEPITLGGSEDFTIDCWSLVNTSTTSWGMIWSLYPDRINNSANRLALGRYGTNNYYGLNYHNGGTLAYSSAAIGTMVHTAIVYDGTAKTISMYYNGVLQNTSSQTVNAVPRYLCIGGSVSVAGPWCMNGTIDEFRISKGIKRWTANFTPPTEPYSGSTVGFIKSDTYELVPTKTTALTNIKRPITQYLITTAKTGSSSIVRYCSKVELHDVDFEIHCEMYVTAAPSSTTPCFIGLLSDAYLGTGAPPSWGSAWIAGQGQWTMESSSGYGWPYNTTIKSSGSWASNITRNTWILVRIVYDSSTKQVTYYRGDTVIGTCSGTISGTFYFCVFLGGSNQIRNLCLTKKDHNIISMMHYNSSATQDEVAGVTWTTGRTSSTSTTTKYKYYADVQTFATKGKYTFDLTKYWTIRFDYKYVSGAASDWNSVAMFGTHYSYGGDSQIAGIRSGKATGGYFTNVQPAQFSTDWTHYEMSHSAGASTYQVYINGSLHANTSCPSSNWTCNCLYFNGGGFMCTPRGYIRNLYIDVYTPSNVNYWGTIFSESSNTLSYTLPYVTSGNAQLTFEFKKVAGSIGSESYQSTSTTYGTYPSISLTNAIDTRSLYFSGSGWLTRSTPMILGGQDFCIDFWCYMDSSTGYYARIFELIKTKATGYNRLCFGRQGSSSNFFVSMIGSGTTTSSEEIVIPMTFNTLMHIALTYEWKTNTLRLYFNGILKGSCNPAYPFNRESRSVCYLGRSSYDSDGRFVGYIDEFRITDGSTRGWTGTSTTTANFVLPKYTNVSEYTTIPISNAITPVNTSSLAYIPITGSTNDIKTIKNGDVQYVTI